MMKAQQKKTNALVAALALVLGVGMATPAQAVILTVGSPTTGDPNLRLWLDSTAAGSLWQDTGGTVAATPGSPVALWQDQSGNGLNVSQGSAGNRPSYNASVGSLGGQAAVDFTGGVGGDALTTANTTGILGNADRTVITVWQNTAFTGQNQQHTFHMGDTTANEAYGHSVSRTGGLNTGIGNHYWAGAFDSTARANLRPDIAVSIWDSTGGTGLNGLDSWYVNGAPSGASDRAPLATGASQLQIGSRLAPFTEGFTGHLAEVIVYDTIITPAERNQLEGYLKSKYGIGQAQLYTNGKPIPGDPILKAWYKADAGVVTAGPNVIRWVDQSAADPNRDLLAPVGNEPTYVLSEPTLSGKPVVRFDGINDFLQRAAGGNPLVNNSPVTGNSDRTVFLVIANSTPGPHASIEHALHFGTAATDQAYGILTRAGGPNFGNHYWVGQDAGTIASTALPTALTFVYDGDGVGGLTGLDAFYVNGASAGTIDLLATGTTAGGVLNTGSNEFTVGARISSLLLEQYKGDIAEIIIYDSKLGQNQIDEIHAYLHLKYGMRIEGASTSIPEPATLSLLALGGLALLRRRRRAGRVA